MIIVRLTKKWCFVENAPYDILKQIEAQLAYFIKNRRFHPLVKSGRWDGKIRLFNLTKATCRLGLVYRILKFLELSETPFEINDQRGLVPDYKPNRIKDSYNKLRDTQKEAIEAYCADRYGIQLARGIISKPPRSGKTLTVGNLINVVNSFPALFIVHKIDLAIQTKAVFEKIFKEKIGLVGDGNFDITGCKIVISTIQSICSAYKIKDSEIQGYKTIKKKKDETEEEYYARLYEDSISGHYDELKEFINKVKFVAIDECHVSGSETFQRLPAILENVEYIVGCSGTPWREDGDTLLIEQLIGAIVYHLDIEEAYKKGYLLPVKIYFFNTPKIIPTSYDYKTQEKEGIVDNKYILNGVKKLIKRLEKKKMSSVIICRQRAQAKQIADKLGCRYLNGSIKGEERQEVYALLNKKKILTIVSTVTDIGVDIPALDCIVMPHPSKSKTSAFQRIRCNTVHGKKKFGYVFVFCPNLEIEEEFADKNYLKQHVTRLKNIYKKVSVFKVYEKEYGEL